MPDQFIKAIRGLSRTPAFSATAVLTIALGVGLTTTVFCVIQRLLVRPLPYPAADRLVLVSEEYEGARSPMGGALLTSLTYHAWRQSRQTLEDIALYTRRDYRIVFGDEGTREAGAAVSPALFGLLGQSPALGRFFLETEAQKGSDQVVVLSHRWWRERFGGRSDAIGRSVALDGRPYTIIGVASAQFRFPEDDVLLWTPLVPPPLVLDRDAAVTVSSAVGRLKPEATPAQAAAEGTAIARGLGARPARSEMLLGAGGLVTVRVRTLRDALTEPVRPALLVFGTSVACLCLLAIANAANLFLARGLSRRGELAVRAALGASPRQVSSALVTENLVIATLGGGTGVILCWALLRVLPKVAPPNFPRLADIALDGATVMFAMAVSLATALVCSLLVTLLGRRVHPFSLLRDARGLNRARATGTRRLRTALLVAQTGLAVVVTVAAIVFGRDLFKLTSVDAGYSTANVLTASVFLPGAGSTPERTTDFLQTLLPRIAGLPGVTAVGASNMMPFSESTYFTAFELLGGPLGPVTARQIEYSITPGYAEAVGLQLRAGRLPTADDARRPVAAALVNEEFVKQFLGDRPVAGRIFPGLGSHGGPTEIVGVVGSVLKDGLDSRPQPELYLLLEQGRRIRRELYVVVRTSGDSSALSAALRSLIREADKTAFIYRIAPLADLRSDSVAQPRFSMMVLVAFATVAVLLTIVGLYASLSYDLSQRSIEYALRAALGADRLTLLRLALWQGVWPALLGLAAGLVTATAMIPLTRAYLFDGSSMGVLPLATAALVVVPVAIAASLVPAMRVAAVNPAELLKGS